MEEVVSSIRLLRNTSPIPDNTGALVRGRIICFQIEGAAAPQDMPASSMAGSRVAKAELHARRITAVKRMI